MPDAPRILIVDDDAIIRDSLQAMLQIEGYQVLGASDLTGALQALARTPCGVVISDVNMSGGDGFELLRTVRTRWPETVVIMITGYGTIESAVEAIKMGAYDYLTKPIIDEEIKLVVERSLAQLALVRENRELRRRLDQRFAISNLVGQDYRMQKVFDLIESVADSPVNVLIQGESGTGKSLVARVLHHLGTRAPKPLIEVACGAIPETLLESELFGHVKGAFTGASTDKEGKFKAADGGTLFLDEIATATPALQVKLLRAIQERQFEPVGSNKTETVDVRFIFASNVDLEQEVESGRFRRDLYYRINVVTIAMPTLAQRVGDIDLLARRFLDLYASKLSRQLDGFTDEALDVLRHHPWPGNVRELENVVERAVVLNKSGRIGVEDLPPKLVERVVSAPINVAYQPASLREALEGPERAVIEAALRCHGWNRQQTADALQINRTTLYKKMKRYRLDQPEVEQVRTT